VTDTRGIAGDLRRNPFPSMNDTEYELFLLTVESAVAKGVAVAMTAYRQENCADHENRTEALETVTFGKAEKGVTGLDQRVENNDRRITELIDSINWFKKLVYGAFITAFVGLAVGIIQFAIIGK